MFTKEIDECIEDMRSIAKSGSWTLEAQVRAYDLLENMIAEAESMSGPDIPSLSRFCKEYDILAPALDKAYDETLLRGLSDQALKPYKDAVDKAAFKVAELTDLHEYAKYTFEIWQTKGLFARQKAIRILRRKAGFRLETKRIGNYVAKTFDLLNEARAEYARAQQTLFSVDMSYKVKPGIYAQIRKRIL